MRFLLTHNIMKTYLSRLYPFIITIFISACTMNIETPTQQNYLPKTDSAWQQHLQKVKQIQSYEAKGQIGYIAKEKRFSSRFQWRYQDSYNYSLILYSNLSTQTLILSKQQNQLQITDQTGQQYEQDSIENLLRNTVGLNFPLEQLNLWLKGQPDENLDYKVGENHLLAHFSYPLEKARWTADYVSYHQFTTPLPKEILLKSSMQTLKIRAEEWKY